MGGHSEHQFEVMQTQDHSAELGHVLPYRVYLSVFFALLILTVLTVGVTRFDFGAFNIVIAMFIASVKATLVAMYFMHLKFENRFTLGYATFPLVLLALLIGGVFMDNPFRATIPNVEPKTIEASPAHGDVNIHGNPH